MFGKILKLGKGIRVLIKNRKKNLHVIAIDYGIKKNILRYFSDYNCKVTVVSCKTSASDISKLNSMVFFYLTDLETQRLQGDMLFRL